MLFRTKKFRPMELDADEPRKFQGPPDRILGQPTWVGGWGGGPAKDLSALTPLGPRRICQWKYRTPMEPVLICADQTQGTHTLTCTSTPSMGSWWCLGFKGFASSKPNSARVKTRVTHTMSLFRLFKHHLLGHVKLSLLLAGAPCCFKSYCFC